MRKYFVYELKKSLWAILVLSAVCLIAYVATVSTMSLTYWSGGLANPRLGIVAFELLVLAFVAPVYCFSFKMQKRSVDFYYALPLKKEKLYAVKLIIGLLLVLIPYTTAFFGGFFTLLCRAGNEFLMRWYVPAYFSGVLSGICLYAINAFVFTRANKVLDGVVYMLAYVALGALILAYVEALMHTYFRTGVLESFTTVLPCVTIHSEFARLIRGYSADFAYTDFVVPCIAGAVAYLLFFVLIRFEKSERAEGISQSWWGYKTLIPAYTALAIGVSELIILNVALTGVAALVATFVYQRKFKMTWRYWLFVGGSILLGVLLNVLIEWTMPPAVNPPTEIFFQGLCR